MDHLVEPEHKEKSSKKSQIYAEGIPMGKSQLTTQKSRWCKWNDFDSYDFYEGKKGLSMVKPTVTKGK